MEESEMKRITKVLTVVIAAVLAMTMCVLSVSAENIFDSAKAIESGKAYSLKITKSDKQFNYKIKVGKSGKMKISATSYINTVKFFVFDEDGSELSHKKADTNIKTGIFNTNVSEFRTNKNTETFKGTVTYNVKPGTYYIQFSAKNSYQGKLNFSVTVPDGDTESAVSSSSSEAPLMLTMDEGDKIILTALASGKEKDVTWSTSKSSVAKVSAGGKVTAVSSGKATITAKSGGKTVIMIIVKIL